MVFTDEEARQFITNYIIVASLFLVGIILTLVKLRPPKRHWKRCVHGHWATREEYCPECGLSLSPVPEAQQLRIEYLANHLDAQVALVDPVMRYHFALWLVDLERVDGQEYMTDLAVTMYKSEWKFLAQKLIAEENR